MKIILASASPRRKELLGKIYTSFEIIPADVDESLNDNISAENAAQYLSEKKARHISEKYPDALVIGSDTTVVYSGLILGKPKDYSDAEKMLRLLSGKTHKVITGVSVFIGKKNISFSEVTEVTFFKLSNEEIEAYLKTDEWKDKAGAYGIQGAAGLFVEKICGDYDNVVGLPTARLNRKLKEIL